MMLLAETTRKAIEATEGLRDTLAGADHEQIHALVQERGEIMTHFENAHRRASEPERIACEPAIHQLHDTDQDLMRACQEVLTQLTQEFRSHAGSDSTRRGGQYNQASLEACINRTA